MERPLPFHGKEETIGTQGLIKTVEFVRIITETLYCLGYHSSGDLLQKESGINLYEPVVNLFREKLLDGRWDECLVALHKIGISDESIIKSASFFILEQKFFELLNSDRQMDALMTLRREISPLCINEKRVHKLAGCIISPSNCFLLEYHSQDTRTLRLKLEKKLRKLLPPTVLIPEGRLVQLTENHLVVSCANCYFHNFHGPVSLYSEHRCGRENIPSNCLQVLRAHTDGVWFLQFSNNGKYLASSGKDKSTIVWEVQDDGHLTHKHTLTGHEKPVLMVAWSPDDCMLLSCGQEEVVRCWDVEFGVCLHVYEKEGLNLISCAWFPDGKNIVTCVSDGSICMWSSDGVELHCWKSHRTVLISDIAVTADNKWIITMWEGNIILLFDKEAMIEKYIYEEQHITSFSLSRDNRYLLLNVKNQEIHIWRIDDLEFIIKHIGPKMSRFVIRSCFGGIEDNFVASGSEDSKVYIWHKHTGTLIEKLPGHSDTVNCVSWNPVNPHMLASGSDDHTIRIWGLKSANPKQQQEDTKSKGVVVDCKQNSKSR